ncbi:MAG TPA: iron ABC transporter permease [Micromonosporaceae bacterium]|nr:iron ABC transporter permease [Micromonosporaceae bacterium]
MPVAQAPLPESAVDRPVPDQEQPPARARRATLVAVVLIVGLAGAASMSMLLGAGDTTPAQAVAWLLGDPAARADEKLDVILVSLRWPRTLAAVVVGVGLGVGGVLLQAVTRNVLAETGILGVNAGAALGVVVGITAAGAETGYAYLLWALVGAFAASALVLAIAASGRAAGSPLRLLLVGLALGMTFKGLTGALLLRSAMSYDQYRFWVLGSLSGVELRTVLAALPAVVLGLLAALVLLRPMSALSLGDDAARALGHRPGLVRTGVAGAVTLLAAAAVAIAGPIAFLGLIAPFAARALVGAHLGAQLAVAGVLAPAILLLADVAGRLVVRPYEAPAAVFVTLLGAPLLIAVARSGRLLTLGAGR